MIALQIKPSWPCSFLYLCQKEGEKKTMTEMPEIASDGLKTKFGHKEFDLRTENDKVWTFRGCFRGQ